MSRLKKVLIDTLLYWIQIVVYIWPSFFIGNGVVGLIVHILVNNSNNLSVRISETLACIFVLCALLFFSGRYSDKDAKKDNPRNRG